MWATRAHICPIDPDLADANSAHAAACVPLYVTSPITLAQRLPALHLHRITGDAKEGIVRLFRRAANRARGGLTMTSGNTPLTVTSGARPASGNDPMDQLEELALSEPLGSVMYFVHISIFGIAAAAAAVLLGLWILFYIYLAYLVLFTCEKALSKHALTQKLPALLAPSLAFLAMRVTAYDAMAVILWMQEGDIFKLGTLTMVVASTLNMIVNRIAFPLAMACVAIPNFTVFVAIAGLIYFDKGLSPEFIAATVAILCIFPYFLLTLLRARGQWLEQVQTRYELTQAQQLEGMGQVAGGVSHDFNNRLSVVSGSLQMLDHAKTEAERGELLATARRAIEHGSSLTRQMLALGRRSPLIAKPTDLSASMLEFSAFLKRVMPANITCEFDADDPAPVALVDDGILQNALLNLALNSRAAMPDGGVLRVEARRVRAPQNFPPDGVREGRCARITVTDTGMGIPREQLDRIFEPFFTTRDVGQGSGLGLSMVRGFAEQSNGLVSVQSREGHGTRVALYLPLSDAAPAVAPAVAPDLTAASLPQTQFEIPATAVAAEVATGIAAGVATEVSDGSVNGTAADKGTAPPKRRVLVVEDNPQLLALIGLKLERDGFDVLRADSGDAAAPILQGDTEIDLLVTDMIMPGRYQGMDMLRFAKARPAPLPVVLISGYADISASPEVDLGDADLFLEKPLNLEELSLRLDTLVARPVANLA